VIALVKRTYSRVVLDTSEVLQQYQFVSYQVVVTSNRLDHSGLTVCQAQTMVSMSSQLKAIRVDFDTVRHDTNSAHVVYGPNGKSILLVNATRSAQPTDRELAEGDGNRLV
jgi:hypothetical protein